MIQLPNKIRTTLFSATVEEEPFELLSHEKDRIVAIIQVGYNTFTSPSFGRSKQDALNNDTPYSVTTSGLYIFGPESLWVAFATHAGSYRSGTIVVHGIYHA